MATKIDLSNLDFENIRASLIGYLSKQDTVKDLNFQGSAVNFLLDLLAYNTLYYAHFANMISGEAFLDSAQLERSIISLVKPLGYVVPTKTSASSSIQLKNVYAAGPLKPFDISVTGRTPEGIKFNFWNIDSVPIKNDSTTDSFMVYEGNYVSVSYGGNGYDFPSQKILITDLNMDINTLQVSVSPIVATPGFPANKYTVWQRYDLYTGLFIENNTQIYSLERTSAGFVISFGTSVGQKLQAGDKVKIEYLSSSGSVANTCSAFTVNKAPNGTGVIGGTPSLGGKNQSDLDKVRSNAPLVFSAQQRLVTATDYLAYLSEFGLEKVKVWGGETNTPATYGRVLVSYVPSESSLPVGQILQRLRSRSVVTVIPEYVTPIVTKVLYKLSLKYDAGTVTNTEQNVRNIVDNIDAAYPQNEFDLNFSYYTVSDIVEQQTGYSLDNSAWYIILEQAFVPQNANVLLNFKTEINYDKTEGSPGLGLNSLEFTTSRYTDSSGNPITAVIRDTPILYPGSTNPPTLGYLNLWSKNNAGQYESLDVTVGKIDYKTGIVTITEKVSNDVVYIQVNPKNQKEFLAKDELFIQTEAIIGEVTPS
jgi:hypothetical protein